jgi:hypothetical protein
MITNPVNCMMPVSGEDGMAEERESADEGSEERQEFAEEAKRSGEGSWGVAKEWLQITGGGAEER